MTQPSYEEILRKLSDEATPEPDGGEATRLRILASLQRRAQGKRKLQLLVPLAALLAASAALAQYVYRNAPEAVARRTRAKHAAPTSDASDGGSPRDDAPLTPAHVEATARAESELHDAGDTRDRDVAQPRRERPSRSARAAHLRDRPARGRSTETASEWRGSESAGTAGDAGSAVVPAHEAAALYGRAHRLHFGGDPAAALAAWDAYLAVSSVGPRALEARYNRAVILIRLGRTREAAAALRPFAAGAHGSSRQAAATRLLQSLEAGTP